MNHVENVEDDACKRFEHSQLSQGYLPNRQVGRAGITGLRRELRVLGHRPSSKSTFAQWSQHGEFTIYSDSRRRLSFIGQLAVLFQDSFCKIS